MFRDLTSWLWSWLASAELGWTPGFRLLQIYLQKQLLPRHTLLMEEGRNSKAVPPKVLAFTHILLSKASHMVLVSVKGEASIIVSCTWAENWEPDAVIPQRTCVDAFSSRITFSP